MATIKHLQHTTVTPSSKATARPHPPVGRDPQVLIPESGNNSVSAKAETFPIDTLTKKNAIKPPWAN